MSRMKRQRLTEDLPAMRGGATLPSSQASGSTGQETGSFLPSLPTSQAPLRSAEMMFFCGEAAGSLLILFYFLL